MYVKFVRVLCLLSIHNGNNVVRSPTEKLKAKASLSHSNTQSNSKPTNQPPNYLLQSLVGSLHQPIKNTSHNLFQHFPPPHMLFPLSNLSHSNALRVLSENETAAMATKAMVQMTKRLKEMSSERIDETERDRRRSKSESSSENNDNVDNPQPDHKPNQRTSDKTSFENSSKNSDEQSVTSNDSGTVASKSKFEESEKVPKVVQNDDSKKKLDDRHDINIKLVSMGWLINFIDKYN